MSNIHFTKDLVWIKDENIILKDKLSTAVIKDNEAFVIHDILSDKPCNYLSVRYFTNSLQCLSSFTSWY